MIRDPKEGYVEELIERLRGMDSTERRHATTALARIGREAVPALIDALGDADWKVRRHAAAALAEAPDSRAVPHLCELLRDLDWEVRREAARALRAADPAPADPSTAAALSGALRDQHPQVRLYAIETLLAIQQRDPRAVAHVWPELQPCLGGLLEDPERRVRPRAAELAGNARDAQVVPALRQALTAGDVELRLAAAGALGKIRTGECLEPLLVGLEDAEERVRAQAARSLGKIPGEAALWHLVRILEGADSPARRAGAQALKRIARERPVPALRAAIDPLRRLLSPTLWLGANGDYQLYRTTLLAIETATGSWSDLPLPAPPCTASDTLPIPAGDNRTASRPAPAALNPGKAEYRPGRSLLHVVRERLPAWLRSRRAARGKPPHTEEHPDG